MQVRCAVVAEKIMVPVKGIIAYKCGETVLCTINDIVDKNGKFSFNAGRLLNKSSLMKIINKMDDVSTLSGVVPPVLLYVDDEKLVWHCPSKIRPILFKTKNEALNAISGRMVAYPNLLFMARRHGLFVWALKHGRRPIESDCLYRAPFMNVSESGAVCMQNAGDISVSSIPKWEELFFNSHFTHMNSNTVVKGGHDVFWIKHVSRKKFPLSYMIREYRTVGNLYAEN